MRLSASTNPPKEEELIDYAKSIEENACDMIHLDCMDGKFVKNSCLDLNLARKLCSNLSTILDCHVMIESPIEKMQDYVDLGISIYTFHYEAEYLGKSRDYIISSLKEIIEKYPKIMLGIAINPDTDIHVLDDIIEYLDVVLIMSVVPGASGQKFIPESYSRIEYAKALKEKKNPALIIEVDGGVNLDNVEKIRRCGADSVVMGSALFNAKDRKDVYLRVKSI